MGNKVSMEHTVSIFKVEVKKVGKMAVNIEVRGMEMCQG
jgi:hypothetical protein